MSLSPNERPQKYQLLLLLLRPLVVSLAVVFPGRTENALSLLHLQVERAVYRLCVIAAGAAATTATSAAATVAAALPETSNLRSLYSRLMKEMQRDRLVPLSFGINQERPEYAEILYNLSLLEFKRTVIFTATKRQLGIVTKEILKSMRTRSSGQKYTCHFSVPLSCYLYVYSALWLHISAFSLCLFLNSALH